MVFNLYGGRAEITFKAMVLLRHSSGSDSLPIDFDLISYKGLNCGIIMEHWKSENVVIFGSKSFNIIFMLLQGREL